MAKKFNGVEIPEQLTPEVLHALYNVVERAVRGRLHRDVYLCRSIEVVLGACPFDLLGNTNWWSRFFLIQTKIGIEAAFTTEADWLPARLQPKYEGDRWDSHLRNRRRLEFLRQLIEIVEDSHD